MSRNQNIVYLACPYTHPSIEVREYRFRAVTRAAARLIQQGNIVFSPVTMTHPIDALLAGSQGTLGSEFWVRFDEAFMDACSELVVLTLDGWKDSEGLARELKYFKDRGRPVRYLEAL